MATPSLAMIPSAYADSKVYSVLPNNGDGDFTFNRDSSATRVGQNGLIQTVGYFGNQLITNGDFATDSDWTKGSSWTISGGTANSDGGNSFLTQNVGFVVGVSYLISLNINRNSGTLFIRNNSGVTFHTIDANNNDSFQSFTYTATTTGLINFYSYDYNGSIDNVSVKEVTGDQPRLNYDISNGVVQSCPSLLLEPASTNLVTYSEDFTQSAWVKLGVGTGSAAVVTSNYASSPDGTQNAARLQCDLNGGTTTSDQSIIYDIDSSNTSQTISIYLKSNNGQNQEVYLANTFGLNDTVVITTEWKRYVFTHSSSNHTFSLGSRGSTGSSDVLDILIWGAQSEALSYATSYIPTNGASQTRAAETCFGAGNAATFNDSEGVLMVESSLLDVSQDGVRISISDGSSAENRITFRYLNNNQIQIELGLTNGFSETLNLNSSVNFNKIAVVYNSTNASVFINGVNLVTNTMSSLSGLSQLQFNRFNSNIENFHGNTRQVQYFDTALTDAQLITLTTL